MSVMYLRSVKGLALAGMALALLAPVQHAAGQPPPSPPPVVDLINGDIFPSFEFKIDPKTPLKDLLPTPPSKQAELMPFLGEDLTQVPEVAFQESLTKMTTQPKPGQNPFLKMTAHQIAKIRFLNEKDADGFMKVLLAERPDLSGLNFAMGDTCRMKKDNWKDFRLGLDILRAALQKTANDVPLVPEGTTAALFWGEYQQQWIHRDKKTLVANPFHQERVEPIHLASLVQVLMPESAPMRLGLAKYLSQIPNAEATRWLAKLAIFSAEKAVRQEAIKGLKVRREKDYTDILLAGLRYPWPPVAQRAADALVQLECSAVVNQLVNLLDEPDPRLPVTKQTGGKEVIQARQMVKLNHHQNCLLCHAPADKNLALAQVKAGVIEQLGGDINLPVQPVTAPVAVPGQPLGDPSTGYGQSNPDILVRIDVTYLRQDFSMFQLVKNAAPWPAMQRFDFLVRTVKLTPAQAQAYQAKLQPKAGAASPYQDALVDALRGLTGQNAGPTAAAWKQTLKLPG